MKKPLMLMSFAMVVLLAGCSASPDYPKAVEVPSHVPVAAGTPRPPSGPSLPPPAMNKLGQMGEVCLGPFCQCSAD